MCPVIPLFSFAGSGSVAQNEIGDGVAGSVAFFHTYFGHILLSGANRSNIEYNVTVL